MSEKSLTMSEKWKKDSEGNNPVNFSDEPDEPKDKKNVAKDALKIIDGIESKLSEVYKKGAKKNE